MTAIKAEKVKKVSWMDTLRKMPDGSYLDCTLKEKLSVAARLAEFKRANKDAVFSDWVELENGKYRLTRIK